MHVPSKHDSLKCSSQKLGRKFFDLLRVGLVFLLLFPLSSGLARENPTAEAPLDLSIRLATISFDPLMAVPAADSALAYSDAEALEAGVYILQFTGPIQDEWKQAAAEAGAVLGDYIPNYAFLAKIDPKALESVRALPFVRWVGAFQPAYKLPANFDVSDTRTYRVILAPWAQPADAQLALTAQDNSTQTYARGVLAELQGADVEAVARLSDVVWVEPYPLRKLFNSVGGGTIMGGSTAWANGYNGAGVHVGAADTGLDTGIAGAIHQDFSGRVGHISSWPVVSADYGGGCYTANAGSNDGGVDLDSGHGTHVSGSMAGNGARSGGTIKGLAYQATLSLQAIEQYTIFGSTCTAYYDGYYLTGLPADLRNLLNEAYTWGVRVHNNSWGGGAYGAYDQDAQYFDDFIYNHPDLVVTTAAGNDGSDSNHDGYVDLNSISSPATAKNVLTVGASENERPAFNSYTWGSSWPSDYPSNPTYNDPIANSRNHLAAFSSRGPMNDGRYKPDVVAPGTFILSTKSSQTSDYGWAYYDNYYTYMGGTSMASPLAAGAAALVRQYYLTTEGQASPSAALIKATLINTAVDITGYGNTSYEAGIPIPNNHEGWGRINVAAATTAGRAFIDATSGVATGGTKTYYYTATGAEPFKVSLVWSDYPGAPYASPTLVNNLNLKVTAPNGATIYWGNSFSGGWSVAGWTTDTVNNVENVYVRYPTAGTWRVDVIGQNVPFGPQPFALVIDGVIALPQSPTNLVSAVIPTDKINLTWADASSNETGFKIERSMNSGGWAEIHTNAANDNTFSDTGLICGANYRYRVRAQSTGGYSEYSNMTNDTLPGCAPKEPTQLAAAAFPATRINLGWIDASNNETGFKIERSTNNVNWTEIASVGANMTSYSDPNLAPGAQYYYRVYAFNNVGPSNYTSTVMELTVTDLNIFLPLVR